ncbi:sirohydrochlorin chelatase [Diaphorobacter sp.]|uniref:sirohydrochlorin chelatase n=1 Tax=Diaphorobacter sp. TaxID=1934310 RepID=UPI003D1205BE
MTPHSGIVLFAHGSRDPLWRRPMEAVRDHLQAAQPALDVRCAYLELCDPSLPATVADMAARGITHIGIVPMFLGTGRHAREDLPRMVQELAQAHAHLQIGLRPPIGEDGRMIALMAQIAGEALESSENRVTE